MVPFYSFEELFKNRSQLIHLLNAEILQKWALYLFTILVSCTFLWIKSIDWYPSHSPLGILLSRSEYLFRHFHKRKLKVFRLFISFSLIKNVNYGKIYYGNKWPVKLFDLTLRGFTILPLVVQPRYLRTFSPPMG